MAISLTGKLVILFISLAVIGGMTAVIVLVVNDSVTTDDDNLSTSTAAPTVAPEGYQVGVGIGDMTGPCVEITFVSTFANIKLSIHATSIFSLTKKI